MLEHYYSRVQTVDKVRALLLGPAMSLYAEWMSEHRVARASALVRLQALTLFDRYLVSRNVRSVEDAPAYVDGFLDHWRSTRCRKPHTASYERACRVGPRPTIEQMLRLSVTGFIGTVRSKPWPLIDLVPGLQSYLRDERGLRSETIKGYEHHLRVFERFLQANAIVDLATLTPAIIGRFLLESTATMSADGRQGRAGVLRVLLRYLKRQGIVATDMSRSVPRGRFYKQARIPRAIPWSDVERVIALADRRHALGKRDYAILMLLATYGLRAQEIAALELSAIDWPGSRFHVLGRKAGNSTTYPLSPQVGEALIDYLRHARPQSDHRHVFLTTRTPYQPISHWCASGRASEYLRRAGITVRRPGSHTFRHSCVQRLVEADVPFKLIGDYVGHRSEAATQVYAKVAIHKLRALSVGGAEEVL
jgi:site-specific recombinase XerD